MTKFNPEKFKITKGIIKKFKVKCHKLDPETSNLTKHQALYSMCESVLPDKRVCKREQPQFWVPGLRQKYCGHHQMITCRTIIG